MHTHSKASYGPQYTSFNTATASSPPCPLFRCIRCSQIIPPQQKMWPASQNPGTCSWNPWSPARHIASNVRPELSRVFPGASCVCDISLFLSLPQIWVWECDQGLSASQLSCIGDMKLGPGQRNYTESARVLVWLPFQPWTMDVQAVIWEKIIVHFGLSLAVLVCTREASLLFWKLTAFHDPWDVLSTCLFWCIPKQVVWPPLEPCFGSGWVQFLNNFSPGEAGWLCTPLITTTTPTFNLLTFSNWLLNLFSVNED